MVFENQMQPQRRDPTCRPASTWLRLIFKDHLTSFGNLLRLTFLRLSWRFWSGLFRWRFLLLGWSWPSLRGFALQLSLLSRRLRLLGLHFRLPISGPASFRGGSDFLPRFGREFSTLLWR